MSINIFKRFMRSKRNDDESSDDEEDKFSSNTFRNNLRKGIYGKTYGEDEFMEAFSYYDTNGDGKITTAELNLVLKKLKINMKKREIKAMIQELDKDRTGSIDYIEV
jgi:Ca2+-binding EF-hand superfamily protein